MNINKLYSTDTTINTLINIYEAINKSYAASLSIRIETSKGDIIPPFGLDSCNMEQIVACIKDNLETQLKAKRNSLQKEINNIDNYFNKGAK